MKTNFYKLLFVLFFCEALLVCCNKKADSNWKPLPTKAYTYQNKADRFAAEGLNDSAYYYYLQSNSELLIQRDYGNLSYNYLKISEIQLFLGDAIGAEESCTEALQYISQQDAEYLSSTYNLLGRCYRQLYDFDKSIEYFTKASELDIDEFRKLVIQNNIANVYFQKNSYNSSIQILDRLIKSPILKQNAIHHARVLDNLGINRFKIDRFSGLEQLQQALHIRDSLQYDHGLVESYANMAQYYIDKDKAIAQYYAKKMYEVSQTLKNPDDELQALSLLIQTSPPNQLLHWSKKYMDHSNSITETRQTAKNQFAKIKYDYQKETDENLKLKALNTKQELDIEREKNQRQILVFILMALVVSIILFVKNSRRRHSEEKAKEIYITETKISKKIHDELANDIYNIVAFTENFDLSNENHKTRLLTDLEKTYNKTRNISSEYGSISFGNDFAKYLKALLQEYNGKKVKLVSVDIDTIDWNSLTDVQKIAIYRVIQELLVNMKKHSHASLVSFKFQVFRRELKISYSDNGTGIVNEKLIAKNGLINAENRIKDIRGSFIFETEISKGLKIIITIPL